MKNPDQKLLIFFFPACANKLLSCLTQLAVCTKKINEVDSVSDVVYSNIPKRWEKRTFFLSNFSKVFI